MSTRTRALELAYKIDSSDITTYVLAFFQIIALIAFRFYQTATSGAFKTTMFYSSISIHILIALTLIMRCIVAGRISTIKLRYNKKTGILFDKKISARNVSLRAETIRKILVALVSNGDILAVGEEVGGDFYRDFEQHLLQKGKQDITLGNKIAKWVDYDSSSGMGRFECRSFESNPFRLVLTITNPFTGNCKEHHICEFLQGYVLGFCKHLFAHGRLTSECEWLADLTTCRMIITGTT